MKRIGFLGCGKIGKALLQHAIARGDMEISFIQDPFFKNDVGVDCPVIKEQDKELYRSSDLIIECSSVDVLKENYEIILQDSDLLMFSVTAFSDSEFTKKAIMLEQKTEHRIYIPHGAILGLDGIFDGRHVWEKVVITTIKNPKSLGREDTERTVIYEGPTRQICSLYPRNVNVHAAIALAGIGFDHTKSVIISDPDVDTNSHHILLQGKEINISLDISSLANGAVTGAYTPYSACGSFDRIFNSISEMLFV